MKNINKLSKLAYEVLIERKLQSFTLIEARDLLLKKYKDEFNEEDLYKHLHRQFSKLCELGFLVRDTEKKNLFFSVTKKFLSSRFEQAKSTKLFEGDTYSEQVEETLIITEESHKSEVKVNKGKPSKNLSENKKNQCSNDKMEVSLRIPKTFLDSDEQNQQIVISLKLK